MHKVFVYGTLKKGYGNHYKLQGAKGYPAKAPEIDLHDYGLFPAAVHGQGQAIGEVYEVDDSTLKKLDELEGHPNFYHRVLSPVILDNGENIEAWIYFCEEARRYPKVENGNWGVNRKQWLNTE